MKNHNPLRSVIIGAAAAIITAVVITVIYRIAPEPIADDLASALQTSAPAVMTAASDFGSPTPYIGAPKNVPSLPTAADTSTAIPPASRKTLIHISDSALQSRCSADEKKIAGWLAETQSNLRMRSDERLRRILADETYRHLDCETVLARIIIGEIILGEPHGE